MPDKRHSETQQNVKNRGTPKSYFLIGFSIKPSILGYPYFGNTHVHQGTRRNATPGFVAWLVALRFDASLDVFALQRCGTSSSNKPFHEAFGFFISEKKE